MANISIAPPGSISAPPSSTRKNRWLLYLLLGLVSNTLLWSVALLYSKGIEPTYTSEWSLTLPPNGKTTNIDLPNIGDASSEVRSPFNSAATQDPRENYRFIATSDPVVRMAAAKLGMTVSEFGKPQVEIIDNTTLMQFAIEADTPEVAQQKSQALYEAFQTHLEELREQEVAQQEETIQAALTEAQDKLENAQQRLSEYKARSGLTSNTQLDQLSTNIEQLRRERALVRAQQQQASARFGQLSNSLSISPRQASDAFLLNADPLFQQNLKDYSEASAALQVLGSQLGDNHPAIVRERSRRDAAQAALLNRGQSLLRRSVDMETLAQLNLSAGPQSSSGRGSLFQETVTAQVDQQGLTAQAVELDRQIAQLEGRLQAMAQRGSALDALTRDVTIAEAVFSATLARLDLSRADTSGSYPRIQLLTAPSLPETDNSALTAKFILLGAGLGSLLITLGLLMLWLKERQSHRSQSIDLPIHSNGGYKTSEYPPETLNGSKPTQEETTVK